MKISTITFHKSVNYGAILQTYALQQALLKCGYESEVVDYARMKSEMFVKVNYRNPKKAVKQLALNSLTAFRYNERKNLFYKFSDFTDSYIKLSDHYDTYEELCKNPPKADMYLMGSDQVWNITYRYRPEFFAEFAPEGVKKASYAASIGNYKYNDQQMKQFSKGLYGINPISVREESAAEFLDKNFDIQPNVHIDPVFLLSPDEWGSIAIKPQIKGKYILCYALTKNKLMQQAIDKLKKETGYKVVVVSSQPNKFVKGDVHIYNAGPREFVGLFKDAEFVLTTSFHGTAFSVLFNKPFYNFTLDYYSSRTNDLLQKLGLTDRVPKFIEDICFDGFDYTKANKIKQEQINLSYDYLNELSTVGGNKND